MLLALWLACADSAVVMMPGTTARVDAAGQVNQKESELAMKIMTTPDDCDYVVGGLNSPEQRREYEECLPWIDRQAGEVKLAVRFELDDQSFQLPDLENEISASIGGFQVNDNTDESDVHVVGHGPKAITQLFVLMIDGSASMNIVDPGSSKTRMDKVRDALLMRSVQDAFFREEVKNSVVIYTFTSGSPQPLGGNLKVLRNKSEYKQYIQQHLKARSGYTHLYNAVDYSLNTVLEEPVVKQVLSKETKPTIVLLTDGFNNEASNDTCTSNVPRLTRLLKKMRKQMDGLTLDSPLIFTVGLGRPLDRRFDPKKVKPGRVTDRILCADQPYNAYIDAPGNSGGLEDSFIDNVSLELLADRGKGRAFIKRDAQGLGEAFQEVAAIRYDWFEVHVRDSALKFRREFEIGYRLNNYARALSNIKVYPHAWMDGPPGVVDEEGWSHRGSIWQSAGILTSGMGLALFLLVLGAAVFNAKRFIQGRLKQQSKKPTV